MPKECSEEEERKKVLDEWKEKGVTSCEDEKMKEGNNKEVKIKDKLRTIKKG